MKKLIVFTLLLGMLINPIISQNPYYLINDDLDKTEYINYDNNTINFKTERLGFNFSFNGNSFEDLQLVNYKRVYLVKGNNNSHLILYPYIDGMFTKINLVKGEYDLVKKEILKGKLGNKTQIINEILPKESWEKSVKEIEFVQKGIYDIEKKSYDNKIKKQLDKKRYIENYNTETKLKDYIGTYKVKFLYHSNYTVNSTGTIYVTNEGITIKCEDIISLNLLRSSHNKEYPKEQFGKKWDEGSFYCKITKGYGGDLMITINKESKSVGLTTGSGSTSKTTSGTIINFTP